MPGTCIAGTIDSGSIGGTPQDLNFAVGGVIKGKISGTTGELEMNGKKLINSLLAEYVVTGSAVTSIDFSGLDINTHKSYRFEIELINATASNSEVYCYINGDTTNTNYYNAYVSGASTATAGVPNNAKIMYIASSNVAKSLFDLYRLNGFAKGLSLMGTGITTSSVVQAISYSKTATVTNITQVTFTASVASSIGVGSKIRIYRGDV